MASLMTITGRVSTPLDSSTPNSGVWRSFGILPSAGDVVGDDIEEGIEIVGGRDHRVVEPVTGLPGLDEKAAYAGGRIIAGVAQAVLDRMAEAGAQRNSRFQIGEDDWAFWKSV